MKRIASVISFLLITALCDGQNNPSFRQFYLNPFYFNPAYTGIDGYTDVYFANRRQWVNFKDAPVISELRVQYPTRGRTAFGFSISNQQVVALQNNFISAAFAYRAPIDSNKTLIFALSGGVGTNSLDVEGYDYSNDPAVLNAVAATFYGNASFGMVYEWKRLRMGLALPQLFFQPYFSPQKNKGFSQLLKQNYSISYKFFSGSFSIEPWFLFRLNNDYQNTWDGGAIISFKETIGLGASYSAQQGTALFLTLDIKERVKMGFSYELPLANPDYISARSVEIQLRVRLGQKRDFRPVTKFNKKPKWGEQKKTAPLKVLPQQDTCTVRPSVAFPRAKPGYYIVAGSFNNPDYASDFKNSLVEKGFSQAEISFDEELGGYLVYIYYSESMKDAEEELRGLQKAGAKSFYVLAVQ